MRQEFVRILRDIFRLTGYTVHESSSHDLIIEKDGYNIFIRLRSNPNIPDMQQFADQIEKNTGIYVAIDGLHSDMRLYGENLDLILWNRDDLATYIGKSILDGIEGNLNIKTMNSSINSKSSTSEEVKNVFSDIIKRSNTYESCNNYTSAINSQSITSNSDLSVANFNMNRDQAIMMGKSHIINVEDIVLKLVPYWRYIYFLKLEKTYKSKIIDISGDGVGFLNGLNGQICDINIKKISKGINVPEDAYIIKNFNISQNEAKENILKMLVNEYTKDFRFDATQGETIISEHKKFGPNVDDIDLDIKLIYIPVWELKGPHNSIELNAHTGEIFTYPIDDDVEFV